jgi:hypothetical protein
MTSSYCVGEWIGSNAKTHNSWNLLAHMVHETLVPAVEGGLFPTPHLDSLLHQAKNRYSGIEIKCLGNSIVIRLEGVQGQTWMAES